MNKIFNIKYFAAIFCCLLLAGGAFAQEPAFPVPTGNPNQLFYLQRTPDANTVVYELNYKDGQLDTDEPVHAYWIRYAEQGQKTELSMIQRHFAYGIKSTENAPDNYSLTFAADKNLVMTLKKNPAGKYEVYININQKPAMLTKIYLQINGGSFWSPNVEYIEFTGIDPATGATVIGRQSTKS